MDRDNYLEYELEQLRVEQRDLKAKLFDLEEDSDEYIKVKTRMDSITRYMDTLKADIEYKKMLECDHIWLKDDNDNNYCVKCKFDKNDFLKSDKYSLPKKEFLINETLNSGTYTNILCTKEIGFDLYNDILSTYNSDLTNEDIINIFKRTFKNFDNDETSNITRN